MSQTSVCDQGSKEIEKMQFWVHDWRVQSHKDCTNWKYGNIYIKHWLEIMKRNIWKKVYFYSEISKQTNYLGQIFKW